MTRDERAVLPPVPVHPHGLRRGWVVSRFGASVICGRGAGAVDFAVKPGASDDRNEEDDFPAVTPLASASEARSATAPTTLATQAMRQGMQRTSGRQGLSGRIRP